MGGWGSAKMSESDNFDVFPFRIPFRNFPSFVGRWSTCCVKVFAWSLRDRFPNSYSVLCEYFMLGRMAFGVISTATAFFTFFSSLFLLSSVLQYTVFSARKIFLLVEDARSLFLLEGFKHTKSIERVSGCTKGYVVDAPYRGSYRYVDPRLRVGLWLGFSQIPSRFR